MARGTRTALLGLTLTSLLRAETSEYPLALNLPTGDMMQAWDMGVGFTHRFNEPATGHSKDLYGLDGYAYPAFGFDFGIKPIKGLNVIIYRTADNKTLTLGFQQRLLDTEYLRLSFRAERFDETVQKNATPLGNVGIFGGAAQLPAEIFLGDFIITLDPAFVSRTTTVRKGVIGGGAGLRWEMTSALGVMMEYYAKPKKVDPANRPGYAAGFTYKTLKHRFTILATNVVGTTANQVFSGDYAGGPRSTGLWSLGFNITRTF